MIKFQDINPEVFDLPDLTYHASESNSSAIEDIVDNIVFYIKSNMSIYGKDKTYEDKTEDELLSIYLDEYFNTDKGTYDSETIDNISSKLSRKFLDAYEILSDNIASDVTMLNDQIQKNLKVKLDACEGYNNPEKIKFDYIDLSGFSNIVNIAVDICNKYNYNVNNLTLLNIGNLYKKITEPQNTDITNETLNKILGEITITIKNDNDDVEPNIEVNTDQEIPTEVEVNGEDKTDEVEENSNGSNDNSSDSIDSGDSTDGSDSTEIENANVDVNTPENTNDNVSVTINGEKINKAFMEDSASEEPIDEEAIQDQEMKSKLYKLIIEAAFNKSSFNKLYNKFVNMHTSIDNKPLKLASWFMKFPVNKLYNIKTPLSDTTRELLESNLESLEDLQRLVAVNIDLTMRNKKDVLIVTPRLLNLPKVDEAKNKGIDVYTWVRDYLRLYHNTNTKDSIYQYTLHSPVHSGITLETLITSRPVVETSLVRYKEAFKAKEKETYLDLLKESFSGTLMKYVNTVIKIAPDRVPYEYRTVNNFRIAASDKIRSVTNQLTKNNYSNIEDSLYNFYFTFWYHDTLVERIYKDTSYQLQADLHKFGTESLDNVKESNIRAKVMTGIVISLLKELF